MEIRKVRLHVFVYAYHIYHHYHLLKRLSFYSNITNHSFQLPLNYRLWSCLPELYSFPLVVMGPYHYFDYYYFFDKVGNQEVWELQIQLCSCTARLLAFGGPSKRCMWIIGVILILYLPPIQQKKIGILILITIKLLCQLFCALINNF